LTPVKNDPTARTIASLRKLIELDMALSSRVAKLWGDRLQHRVQADLD
jgi:hypothetical protein